MSSKSELAIVKPLIFVSALALVSLLGTATAGALSLEIIVEAGDHARTDTPVSISVADADGLPEKFRLSEIRDGKSIPTAFQRDGKDSPLLWWILEGDTPAGSKRTYKLEKGAAESNAKSTISVNKTAGYLEVLSGDKRILRYHTEVSPLPPDADPNYKRSGYINPVWTPSGEVVTNRAQDYLHQLGIWNANFLIDFEGRNPNFWHMVLGNGKVRCVNLESTTTGPVYGGFRAHHEQTDLKAPEGPKVAINEIWDVRAWNIGGGDSGYWVFDLGITMSCASSSPVTFKKHTWGAVALRGGATWNPDRCRMFTSEGKTRNEANHTRVRWVEMSGSTNEVWSGLTVMSHPSNFRHPEPVRVNETIPYVSFTPEVLGDWQIVPGKDHSIRYRYFIHDGTGVADDSERVWNDFAHPPKAYFAK